jgi:pSer/pThr/pTyr-binding forkhead associated (FHA) protein
MISRIPSSDENTWQVVMICDKNKALPRNAQILRLIDLERQVEYVLGQTMVIIGRMDGVDLPIGREAVSRLHAKLQWQPQGWLVTDLESQNGTQVNGQTVLNAWLQPGDLLTLGDYTLEVDQIPVRALLERN